MKQFYELINNPNVYLLLFIAFSTTMIYLFFLYHKDKREQRIFISGKVSGTDLEETRVKFAWAELDINWNKPIQKDVINPMDFGLTFKDPWICCMIVSIWNLLKCKSIYMINDYQDSKGARIELWIAKKLKYKVIYQ
jgi:hypothetical protein